MEAAENAPTTRPEDLAVEPPAGPLLELLTRSGCHLCEDARGVVSQVASELGLAWQEIGIDDDVELTARYGEEIPVVLVDGIQRDFWQIDPVRLRTILGKVMEQD